MVDVVEADFCAEKCYWECMNQNCTGWLMNWFNGTCQLIDGDCVQDDDVPTVAVGADYYDITECGKPRFSGIF